MGEADSSKGLKTQAQTMNKDNRSEDFWSSSAIELDHSATQSQRSISSIVVSSHPSDPQCSDGIQTDPPEFVNHGKFAVIFQFIYYYPFLCTRKTQVRQRRDGNRQSSDSIYVWCMQVFFCGTKEDNSGLEIENPSERHKLENPK